MEAFLALIIFTVGACAVIAWIMSIYMFIDAARAKGYKMKKTGMIWFVGIFTTPIVAGLYVNALPDKSKEN